MRENPARVGQLAQLSDQLKALIGSDTATNDQQDTFVTHGSRVVFPALS